MSEKTGTVTGFIQKKDGTNFGLNLDGEEYLYSFPDKRGEPWDADKVNVGDTVRIECNPYEKDGKTKQYIAVIERLSSISEPGQPPSAASQWGFEQKDRLMCRESCAKSAVAIFAASIQAGIYKTHPDVSAVTAYAGALEKWCLEAVE